VLAFLLISAIVVLAAGANDQALVLFYAVSVFMSFLVGQVAMAKFDRAERRFASMAISLLGALLVAFTLVVNLSRGDPIASMFAASFIAFMLYRFWVRAGRPRGIAQAVVEAESGGGAK
jgi:hypothetical protein